MIIKIIEYILNLFFNCKCNCNYYNKQKQEPELNCHYNCITCGVKRVVQEIPEGAIYICPLCYEQKWKKRGNAVYYIGGGL